MSLLASLWLIWGSGAPTPVRYRWLGPPGIYILVISATRGAAKDGRASRSEESRNPVSLLQLLIFKGAGSRISHRYSGMTNKSDLL